MSQIRAGRLDQARPPMGQWVFVDPRFARTARSCGLLIDDGEPTRHTFAQLQAALVSLAREPGPALHLVLEAPLSVAFGPRGNPVGRSIELRDRLHRYWYTGASCAALVATTHLLRAIDDARPVREIRLFEGRVSFKPKVGPSSQSADVLLLRQVLRGDLAAGQVVAPEALAAAPDHVLSSAFAVAGMDCGVPPALVAGPPMSEPRGVRTAYAASGMPL